MLPAQAQLPEYQVKAAFLINMAKVRDWPAHALPPGAPLIIAIVGDDPFGSSLEAFPQDGGSMTTRSSSVACYGLRNFHTLT
jgi:hypothetical protein